MSVDIHLRYVICIYPCQPLSVPTVRAAEWLRHGSGQAKWRARGALLVCGCHVFARAFGAHTQGG
jgi:hypothetical protein